MSGTGEINQETLKEKCFFQKRKQDSPNRHSSVGLWCSGPKGELSWASDGIPKSGAPDGASKILLVKLILELILCEGGNVSFQEDTLNHRISEALWDSKWEIKTWAFFSDLTEEVAESFRSGPKIISSSRLNAIVCYACTIFKKSTSKHFRYSAGLLSGDDAQKSPSEKPFESEENHLQRGEEHYLSFSGGFCWHKCRGDDIQHFSRTFSYEEGWMDHLIHSRQPNGMLTKREAQTAFW